MQQGQHAAEAMMGDAQPYEVVPYFFSDLADWASLEYVGPATDWDEEIWRGDLDAGEFAVLYLKDGKVAGALSVERSEDLAHARTLLAEGVDVGAEETKALLGDPDSDLAALTQA
jgi:3-phenylpropionate/trans-cinnamate dioxygenase ferredoxin reductase component